ncbi:hypothetical protein Indivirus_6_7 [Indivirus ILV1]|uniref:Uncharacterized protein n=1 Tax=Indivirus ILV1 TaxID=1977633 RepID=A0A1V0SE27_9VIRU|nr:hypothetical protein Indivirus_6_7 [Indivirus ILV1]
MNKSKEILVNDGSIKDHIELQNNNYNEYLANLFLLFHEYNVDFTISKLAKILVASMTRMDHKLSEYLLENPKYDLPAILKTCEILDSKRLYKQLEKKTGKIKNSSKLSKHKSIIANLKSLNENLDLSLSTSKINFIKNNWIRHLSKDRLEYMALLYPIKQWKYLIDLFHLKPNDFQLSWFSNYIFTKEYPKESIIDICNKMTIENISEILVKYKLPYDFLRVKYFDLLNQDIMKIILEYSDMACIIRHWENFNNEYNSENVIERLNKGEIINMPYGELMKRIQLLKDEQKSTSLVNKLLEIAETKLCNYQINIEQPIVVFGDASGSMDVAIRTSSIITSILVKICQAKMHLFREKDEIIHNPPTNVLEVLEAMKKFKAYGCTAPCASLYPYYKNKEIVKTFILVTDEVENMSYDNNITYNEGFFDVIFKKYREEVYPAKLVFISFLDNNKDGQMVQDLKKTIPGIEKDITQFIMSSRNPDLRKLDELLNTLSLDTDFYNLKLQRIIAKLNEKKLFDKESIDNLLNDNLDDRLTIYI